MCNEVLDREVVLCRPPRARRQLIPMYVKQVLNKVGIAGLNGGGETQDTIGKAAVDPKNSCFSNICRNRNTGYAWLPYTALCHTLCRIPLACSCQMKRCCL